MCIKKLCGKLFKLLMTLFLFSQCTFFILFPAYQPLFPFFNDFLNHSTILNVLLYHYLTYLIYNPWGVELTFNFVCLVFFIWWFRIYFNFLFREWLNLYFLLRATKWWWRPFIIILSNFIVRWWILNVFLWRAMIWWSLRFFKQFEFLGFLDEICDILFIAFIQEIKLDESIKI